MALLTIPESDSVLVSSNRETWTRHPISQDTFWKKGENEPAETRASFEFVGSKSNGSEIAPDNHVPRQAEGEVSKIGPTLVYPQDEDRENKGPLK